MEMDSSSIDRRTFVRTLPVVGAVGVAAVQTACGGLPYVPATPLGSQLRINAGDMGPLGRAFVAVPGSDRPVFLHRTAEGAYVAVLAECTHRRCLPEPAGDRLVCPCHGSEYTLSGEVVEGPAERDLPRFEVREEDAVLVIELGERS